MIATVTIDVDVHELDNPTADQALSLARVAASRLGIPDQGVVTPALDGMSYRASFGVTVDPVLA